MTTQEQIAVMQAFVDGKPIQYKDKIDGWRDCYHPLWDWNITEFRIKPEPILPTTWEEFCNTHPIKVGETYIRERSSISSDIHNQARDPKGDRNVLPNVSTAKAMLALCQLIQLRDCYNDGWQPDWSADTLKFVIYPYENDIEWDYQSHESRILAFKSKKIRNEFYENFKDLIEIAKPLL